MKTKFLASIALAFILTFVPFLVSAKGAGKTASVSTSTGTKKTKTRDIQEVNFGEMNLKGTIRNPDGAYLVQKKGIKFMPLHDIQKDMDKKIRETSLYIE
ncbi:hypothetical protein CIK05_10570 [Bdellovibrio sp. qaytius]|nr:hypothetical protein CIK05_10570 [Bdellovibrio sp. qaytius]